MRDVFDHYDVIAVQLPHVAWHFLDIIAINTRTHLLFGRRLLALVHSDDRDLTFSPVGASPVVVA